MSKLPYLLTKDNTPFSAADASWLNDFLPRLDSEQRHWLAGFLAGMKIPQETASISLKNAPSITEEFELTILFGTESGNAEVLAKEARQQAQKVGFNVKVSDLADYSLDQLKHDKNLLLMVSTWGDGDPPQSATAFYEALMGVQAPKLENLRFSVCALGDSSYQHFCKVGKDFDQRLEALGAKRIYDRVDCDVDYDQDFESWLKGTLIALKPVESAISDQPVSSLTPHKRYSRKNPFHAKLISNVNLNGGGGYTVKPSDKETRHIELDITGSGFDYEPGDALGVIPTNDYAVIDEVIKAAGLNPTVSVPGADGGELPLRDALHETYEITTITRLMLQRYAERSGNEELKRLVAKDNTEAFKAYAYGREIIDLLHDYPIQGLTEREFVGFLRKLPPRLYSIASSLKAHPNQLHLTVAAVRYHSHDRHRKGVCSTYVADRVEVGSEVPVYLHKNKNFKLPEDSGKPIIMVGPGTGIAPFRSFIEERNAIGAKGRNWLFYGDRRSMTDFLYQTEWQQYLTDGVLSRLDLAFSRDTEEKVYVQHKLLENAREIYSWLEEGAYFYVCGDASKMAVDVHNALLRIIEVEGDMSPEAAKEYLQDLQQAKRYQRDVY